jgi:hypothetical protein
MNILERIKQLEKDVKALRIIDTEDINAVDTGLGIELYLEDPDADEENGGDTYEGYFKAADISTAEEQKIVIYDGGYEPEDAPDIAGYAVINDIELSVGKQELVITGGAYVYAEFVALLDSKGNPVSIDTPAIVQYAERKAPEDNKFRRLLKIVDWNDETGVIERIRRQHCGEIHGYIFKTCSEAAGVN